MQKSDKPNILVIWGDDIGTWNIIYNLLDYLTGQKDELPGKEFWYVNDDSQVVAARYEDWKVVYPFELQ